MASSDALPVFSLTSAITFTLFDIFIVLALIKALVTTKKKLTISFELKYILFYFLLISIPVSFIFGFGQTTFFNSLRPFFYFSIIISFYYLIDQTKDLYKFGYLLIPYMALSLFGQLYQIVTAQPLIEIIDPDSSYQILGTATGATRYIMYGTLLNLYVFFFGFVLYYNKKYELYRGLSTILIFLPFLSFFLSATRSWMVILSSVLLMFFINERKNFRLWSRVLISVPIIILIFSFSNILQFEFITDKIWPRYGKAINTILTTENNQISDGNSRILGDRLTKDLPELLDSFKKSPVFGVGLSQYFFKGRTSDLGGFNNLLIYGILGLLIWIYFIYLFIKRLYKISIKKIFYRYVEEKGIILPLRFLMVGIVIGFFATHDFFSGRSTGKTFFIALIIATAEVAVYNFINKSQVEDN